MVPENTITIRLNKAISGTGYCSRRDAENIIEQGRVTIKGYPDILVDMDFPDGVIAIDG